MKKEDKKLLEDIIESLDLIIATMEEDPIIYARINIIKSKIKELIYKYEIK